MSKFIVLLVIHLSAVLAQVQFRVIRQWRYLNYTWPSPQILQEAISTRRYIPENVVTAGITYYDNSFYLTMPRMKEGVPATLGQIPAAPGGSTSPKITPFPSWDLNELNNCDALQNVQNIEIDNKGQMWIIDGGHSASLSDKPLRNCSPKLVIYDLTKNATVTTHVFPENVASKNDSFLYDLVVDGDFVYITDNSREDPGIIVFSLKLHRSWKIRHSKSMKGDPAAQTFKINEVSVNALINIAGIALGPKMLNTGTSIVINQDREVFYCPMSSMHLYSISTSILQNESSSNNGQDYPGEVVDVGIKASQTDGMVMTDRGVLYYGLLGDNSIGMWDSQTPFASGQKVVSRDSDYIQWTNSFTIDNEGKLTVLSNTLQKFIYGRLDISRYNFWLLSAQVEGHSYLYEDPSLKYKPAVVTTASAASTEQPRVTVSQTPKTPKPVSSNEVNSNNVVGIDENSKDGAGQIVLEFSVVFVALCAWVFQNNFVI